MKRKEIQRFGDCFRFTQGVQCKVPSSSRIPQLTPQPHKEVTP